jgi:RNA polymerase sigma-70 factor (ECF subfamily)
VEKMTREQLIETVENYRATVFRIAYGYTGNFEDSEDISQDVFLKLYESGKTFKDEEHKKAWLIRVAVNASKSLLRTAWKKRSRRGETPIPEDKPYYDDVADRELFDCVARLPEKYRTVVYLHYYEDYPTAEVARLMGISQSAVTTRLSRAREELKRTFAKGELRDERFCKENV